MAFPASVLGTETTEIKVGSKAFTESVILGEMLTRLADAAGAHATHRAELGGTQIAWQALLRGEIDAYVEYTGTLKEEIFAGRGLSSNAQIERVLAEEHIGMSRKLGFNNTYALAMREVDAERLGIGKISELAQHPDLRFGLSDEFMERKDGWTGLQSRYKLPQTHLKVVDHALAYRGLGAGKLDVTDIYSTDPEIVVHGLRVLEDDLNYFPSYHAVILYRAGLRRRAPAFVTAIHSLEGCIDSPAMTRLNAQVRIDGLPEAFVAASFLQSRIDPSIVDSTRRPACPMAADGRAVGADHARTSLSGDRFAPGGHRGRVAAGHCLVPPTKTWERHPGYRGRDPDVAFDGLAGPDDSVFRAGGLAGDRHHVSL